MKEQRFVTRFTVEGIRTLRVVRNTKERTRAIGKERNTIEEIRGNYFRLLPLTGFEIHVLTCFDLHQTHISLPEINIVLC